MKLKNLTIDSPLLQCFVSPVYCKELLDLGLTNHTPYRWMGSCEKATLFTDAFDLDDYYKDSQALVLAFEDAPMNLPAYQLKDVEKVLPDYALSLNHGSYILSFFDSGTTAIMDERMPDAFARLLIKSIKEGKLSVDQINTIIASKENV